MSRRSTQERIFRNGMGYSEDQNYGVHPKRPCFPARADTRRLPEIVGSHDIRIDPKFREDSKSENVCFGMLKDIQIRFNYGQDTYYSMLDKLNGDNTKFTTLQLEFLEDRCDILIDGVRIAIMGTKAHYALNSLSSSAMLTYHGMAFQTELRQKLAVTGKPLGSQPSKTSFNIALIVYGPWSIKDTLAKELARFRLFLQHPVPMPEGVVYKNPQYLSTATSSFGNGAILPPIPIELFRQDYNKTSTPDADESTTIATVLDNLPQHDYVGNIDIDTRIKTVLLNHQTEAVTFLVSRESTEKQRKILWKLETCNSQKPIYRHTITGSTSPKPNDILGGILGDGMGLGKTLSMICCIVASMASGAKFANSFSKTDSPITMSPAPVSSTLVVVPSVLLLDVWMDEIKRHVIPGTLSVYKYHGPNRNLPSSSPLPYDIILSTYGTITADFSRGGGVLTCFHWYRLILDEAHIIRNWSTKQFKAIQGLSTLIRWCITGTPVQNSLKDLASLVTFLRVPLLDDPTIFRKHIEGTRNTVNGVARTNYRNLRRLLESICLRRCTSSILSSLGVSFTEHRLHLSEGERKSYNELSILCGRYIKAAVNGTSSEAGNKSILFAVLRLRMFCNIGILDPMGRLLNDIEDEDQLMPDEVISLLQQCGQAVCTSCKTEVSSSDTDANFGKQQDAAHGQLKCGECTQRALSTQHKRKASNDFERPRGFVGDDIMQAIRSKHDHALVLLKSSDQTN